MARPRERPYSCPAREAMGLLGGLIRVRRLERRMTAGDLAERAGISRPLLARIERGDPGCSIGAVFETAVIVGVDLFGGDRAVTALQAASVDAQLALLPKAARRRGGPVDDDF